jgi:hypothetical protein
VQTPEMVLAGTLAIGAFVGRVEQIEKSGFWRNSSAKETSLSKILFKIQMHFIQ